MSDAYARYTAELVVLGHDRDWIRRNEPALRQRMERDPEPFRALPEPYEPLPDRYDEL